MQRAQLRFKSLTILKNMYYATSWLHLARGLMFSSKTTIKKGMCLRFPKQTRSQYNHMLTNLFVFSSLEVIFIDKHYQVVDKTVMKPFQFSYLPAKPCQYAIESLPGTFKDISVDDTIKIIVN